MSDDHNTVIYSGVTNDLARKVYEQGRYSRKQLPAQQYVFDPDLSGALCCTETRESFLDSYRRDDGLHRDWAYFASNPTFEMLALGNQHAAATSEAEHTMLPAAGQAMLVTYDRFPLNFDNSDIFVGFVFV